MIRLMKNTSTYIQKLAVKRNPISICLRTKWPEPSQKIMDVSKYTAKWDHSISHERNRELFYSGEEGLFEINKFRTISPLSKSEIFAVIAQRMTS